jgi:hypothetical protein
MRELKNIIKNYSKDYINSENNWYNWREINEKKLPREITLPNGNQYLKNIVLKKELNEKWENSETQKKRSELIKYYITTWGGIHTNSPKSMNEYSTFSSSQLITEKGKEGIASWSKAIVIHNPNQYAIFDARVSISLNCIQKLYSSQNKVLFPILPSRNKVVDFGNKLVKKVADSENWDIAEDSTFYLDYLEILRWVSTQLKSNISTVEMLLFAKAEDLVERAFQSEYDVKFRGYGDEGFGGETQEQAVIADWNAVIQLRKIDYSNEDICNHMSISADELTTLENEYNRLVKN